MDIETFRQQLRENLTSNILPFWMDKMADPYNGFYGRCDGDNKVHRDAPRGAILNARILWAFSAAYRLFPDERYLEMATNALSYIEDYFIDKEYGGVYWEVDAEGRPIDTKKQFYAIGFAIYGLSEYFRAFGTFGGYVAESARERALSLFHDIEKHSRDYGYDGYIEAATREWMPITDMRLSDKDDNASKTMNTHLHILEPYTNLLRIVPDNQQVREAVGNLINIFLDKIEDPRSHHLGLFFDKDWTRRDGIISYGHDIEASWLLLEAARVLGDPDILKKTLAHTKKIAIAALEGRCFDGSMVYERHADGRFNNDKHWWVQAENVIGQIYLWKFHGLKEMYGKAVQSWEYIRDNLVDNVNGEWIWSRKNGEINTVDDKAGFWKCPYHNSRMCLEVIECLDDKQEGI